MAYILTFRVSILLGIKARISQGRVGKVVLNIVSADKSHCKWSMCEVTGSFEVEEDGRYYQLQRGSAAFYALLSRFIVLPLHSA